MDVLTNIYTALQADPLINEKVGNRIKFYEYPETADVTKPYIIIDPLAPPNPTVTGDNVWLVEEQLIQIDVWAKTRTDKDAIGRQIREVMQGIGYAQQPGGMDEYDKDVKIFRDGRRYIASHHKHL